MIELNRIEKALRLMHFENNGNIFSKSYDVSDRPLIIDIANNHIKLNMKILALQ